MTEATYRVEVWPKQRVAASNLHKTASQLGINGINAIYPARLFFVQGDLTNTQVETVANGLLADPVSEQFTITDTEQSNAATLHTIDVTLLPGVTDPAAENLTNAAKLLGIELSGAATGQTYQVDADAQALEALAVRVLANPVVQQVAVNQPIVPPFTSPSTATAAVETVSLRDASDEALDGISRERRLSLNRDEMMAIRTYYQEAERDPTDIELEMLAQTWSEHCVHKTFKAIIEYTGPDGDTETVDGLLNQYIRAATDSINKPWVYSAFEDDAGIIRFNDAYDVAFKVETHNHPSALEPFGGANTGVGGVIRDVLAVSARPIANTDILCFGMPDTDPADLPEGVLHPRRIADGVIHGIEDYGNKMGIPTVNGSIQYHQGYTANPLVYCGCLGVLPHDSHRNDVQPGDLIVALGGRVGRDGLRGATFSSMEMDTSTSEIAGTAVQIGHPIMEKQVLEVVLRCRDADLYTALTDCGAGGFSSSVGELGEKVGATVELANVSLKYPGLAPWEIWLSEAQERMVLAVPPRHLAQVQALAAGQDVEATVLGTFEPTGRMTIKYQGETVGDLTMAFLHDGLPPRHLAAEWQYPTPPATSAADLKPHNEALLALLAHPTIRSKEDVVRRYDHEVQTGTATKPLVGVNHAGPGDATVLVPQATISAETPTRGVALSNGICPTYGELDPYAMAWAAVDEAMRNLVAVGTNPDEVAILDNFCWGNPNLPDRLGALVRCAQGCHDAAVAYRTPYISGKDSLNNEYVGEDGQKHAIPGTILISAVGMVPDVEKSVSMDFKRAGNLLFIVGDTRNEMGGSQYALLHGEQGGTPPQPLTEGIMRYRALHRAIRSGVVAACHDLSEGGLAVAAAEMALAGQLGAEIELKALPANVAHDAVLLFSESIGRFLVEVAPENEQAFINQLLADKTAKIGRITEEPTLSIAGYDGETVLRAAVSELEQAFRGHVAGFLPVDERPVPIGATSSTLANPYQTVTLAQPKKVAILHANGTNRDRDAALACELAGGMPEIIHLNQLMAGDRQLSDYHMLVVPGGFSYGDDLGAGVLFSAELRHRFHNQIQTFVNDGRPTLGICNGFQVLVKAGVFDEPHLLHGGQRGVTLTYNENGRFECRWVWLEPNRKSSCVFTANLTEPIHCPVAHGEGRFMVADGNIAARLQDNQQIALTYAPAGYPANPNGSLLDIAGISNRAGNVLGLMPHPENHIFPWQHPRRQRGESGLDGLRLFANGLQAA